PRLDRGRRPRRAPSLLSGSAAGPGSCLDPARTVRCEAASTPNQGELHMTARTMRRGGLGLGAVLVVVAAIVLSLGAGQAKALTPWLYIDTSPGTGAPPPTLGG